MVPVEVLRTYVNAEGVCDKTLETLSRIASTRSYAAGDIIFREDQKSDHLLILVSGQVDVQYLLKSGKRKSFDTIAPGDFLIWSAVIKPHKTSSIGICRAQSEIIAIEAEPLRSLCEEDTLFGFRLMSQLAQSVRHRLAGARRQLAELE